MRKYSARETSRMDALDGIELADFHQRAAAFVIDAVLALMSIVTTITVAGLCVWLVRVVQGHSEHAIYHLKFHSEFGKLALETVVPVLYFGAATYFGDGRTPGKRLTGIRVVSLVHKHMTLWHSIERALGYAAAALECGFGFAQFFIHPYRRTVQDRIAETIVVKEKSYCKLVEKPSAV